MIACGDKMNLNKRQKQLIEKLYTEMYYKLTAYAQSALNNRLQAEEAVQDTFRIACAKPDALLSSKNPKGWLFETLKNVIKNILRSRARLNKLLISIDIDIYVEDTKSTYAYKENIDLMYSNIAEKEDYKLLKKIALEKCTMLEAAQELGISVEACKKRVQRARKRLQKYIKE